MGLELKNVTKKFKTIEGENILFEDLSITFPKQGLVVITGESGCGKSTLLQLIAGIDQEYEGEILFNQKNIKEIKDYRQQNISFVYQNYQLIDYLTVKENCLFYCHLKGIKVDLEKYQYLSEIFELQGMDNQKIKDLSGGQKQRVALMRALLCSSALILCDEPTGALDNDNRKKVYEILKKISRKHLVIIVSHDQESLKYSSYVLDFNCLKHHYHWNYQLYLRYETKKRKCGSLLKEMIKMMMKDQKKAMMMFVSQLYMILAITLIISGLNGFQIYYQKQYTKTLNNNLVMIQKKDQNPFKEKEIKQLKGNYLYRLDMGKIEGLKNFQSFSINKKLNQNEVYVNNTFIEKYKKTKIAYILNRQSYELTVKGVLHDTYQEPIIYYSFSSLPDELAIQCVDLSTGLIYVKNKDFLENYISHLPMKYQGTCLVYEEYRSYFELIDLFTKISSIFILLSFLISLVLMGYLVLSMFYENQKIYALMLANGYQNKHLNLFILKKVTLTMMTIGVFSCFFSFCFLHTINYFDISKIIFGISKLFILPKIGKYSYFVYVFYLCCYGVQGILLSLFMFIKMKKIKMYECLREE